MSDPLCMSLDDIIKKEKKNKKKPQVLGVKGSRRNRFQASLSFPARRGVVARNFRGKFTKNFEENNSIATGTVNKARNNNRYFNSRKLITFHPQQQQSSNWNRGRRQQISNNETSVTQFSRNLRGRPRAAQQQRGKDRRTWNTLTNQFNSIQNVPRQPNLRFAQKSVSRARQLLIKSRILANRRKQRNINLPSVSTDHIRTSKFGLFTARSQNFLRRRAILQQKFERANQIRDQMIHDSVTFIPRRQGQGPRRAQNRMPMDLWSPTFPRTDFGPNRRRAPRRGNSTDDGWIPPLIQVQNSEFRQSSHPAPSGLDPNIQRKIMFIQQQGRRSRGEENVNRDVIDEAPTEFRSTIISSRMSLSERFKRFMN